MLHLHRQPAERLHRVPIATQIAESMHKDAIRTTYTNDDVDMVISKVVGTMKVSTEWEEVDWDYGYEK